LRVKYCLLANINFNFLNFKEHIHPQAPKKSTQVALRY